AGAVVGQGDVDHLARRAMAVSGRTDQFVAVVRQRKGDDVAMRGQRGAGCADNPDVRVGEGQVAADAGVLGEAGRVGIRVQRVVIIGAPIDVERAGRGGVVVVA